MSKVTRYFHVRNPYASHKGGHCVKVTGDTDVVGQVDMQVVKCSRKDMYNKKIGRGLVDNAPIKIIPLRYLPRELDDLAKNYKANFDYSFAIKYFLPKE